MKRGFIKKMIGCLIAIALLFFLVGPMPAMGAEIWKQKFARFSATAGETLAIGDVVCIKNADGKAWKADANASTLRPAVGVIGKGGAASATVEIISQGILAGQASLSTGYRLFLSETPGGFTTTGPTNAQIVGWVLPTSGSTTTSTTYYINVVPPVSTGAAY